MVTSRSAPVWFRGFHIQDRKSTRLNSSHSQISYAVFCLKKKKKTEDDSTRQEHAASFSSEHRAPQEYRPVKIATHSRYDDRRSLHDQHVHCDASAGHLFV